MKEKRVKEMLLKIEIEFTRRHRNFVQNINQTAEYKNHNKHRYAICKLLTALLIKIQVFWEVTQFRSVNTFRSFAGISNLFSSSKHLEMPFAF